ncbi:ig-like domain-containing protein [Nephila pilipes]|uniref:Ig-like domain-containing protein n=1 Tax=Nephila pilipes TaxID=299642 RepID=A0A8X6T5X6_NEPPI|nr:ig-like domain-containing protein [Nephila pilipes]
MGAYLCIASNGVSPAVSRRITLQVHFPPMIWIPNQLVGANLGANITLECNTEAYPESINYWSRHESQMISNGGRYHVIFTVTTYKIFMVLTIHQVSYNDFGIYTCNARNSLSSTTGTIRLYEIHVPQLIKEPSTAKIHSLDGTSDKGGIDPDYEKEQIRKAMQKEEEEDAAAKISVKVLKKEEVIDSGKLGIQSGVLEIMVSVSIALIMPFLFRPGT